eukprot:scaffold38836_cov67-Phaeocystis_antarctica.AAC.4
MARSPRQRSVGTSAAAVAKFSAAFGIRSTGESPASIAAIWSIANPVNTTRQRAHTTRIARASVEKRARRRRHWPGGATHHRSTAAVIDKPAKYMTVGGKQITNSAHPACPMTKLTRSRRPTADARAARSTPLTAAELAAPEGVL